MKQNKKMDKVKEAELKLKSDEVKSNQDTLEKYLEQTAELNAVISELKEDQENMNKGII